MESGLRDEVSDIVARGTFSPTNWLDVTYRTRLDKSSLATHYAEAVSSVGVEKFRLSGGYIYTNYQPVQLLRAGCPTTTGPVETPYYFPRNEVTLGVSSKWGFYRFNGTAVRDVATNQMVVGRRRRNL